MNFIGIEVDKEKLYSKQALLDHLRENGENDRVLADIRTEYRDAFGNEMMWRYPISDGLHAGAFIVLVQEGFISLPFDEIDIEDYEILNLEDAALFDEDAIQYFTDDWKLFSDDLMEAMTDIKRILAE